MTQDRPRRLAAVWFADIVGYTDLSARDEDLALRVVRELQRIAKKHCLARGGRVVKLMGDAVLTVFDSVDGAVRAAIALRDEFLGSDEARRAEVSIRIGVHLGEVADAPDGDVYGDAVNVASRIERVAEPGQVVISQMAYFTIQQRASMEADSLGEYDLKGLPEPLRLYSVSLESEEETAGIRELLQEAIAPLQLLDVEGMGGMGEIYLARDPGLRRTLAVKVLKSELAADSQARARFQREATVIAGLSHPNVITIHSVGELKDETPYFVMDYIEGGSLADRLEQEGPLSVPEARRILGEVASALAAAHAKGITHRDIKAANILWDLESGRVLVTDWGIAALDPTVDLAPETRLTRTGVFIGSPQYMSPEQLAGDEVGPETDIYSLGLLAFELLTGQGPFPAETPREIMVSHLREDPPGISTLREEVDPELEALVSRCLCKTPSDRPSAFDMTRLAPGAGAALEWPPPGLERLRGSVWKLAGVVGLTLLVASWSLLLPTLFGADWGFGGPASLPDGGALLLGLSGVAALATFPLALFAGIDTSFSIWRGFRLGYGWQTLMEVASDLRGDTGRLIVAAREYAVLNHRQRQRLRLQRVGAAAVALTSAVTLPVATALIPLAAPDGKWILLPLFLGLILALDILAVTGPKELSRAKRKLKRTLRSPVRLNTLVNSWKNAAAKGPPGILGTTPSLVKWLMPVGVAGLGLLCFVMAVTLSLVALAVFAFAGPSWAFPSMDRALAQWHQAQPFRDLQLTVDETLGPEEAGQLLRELAWDSAGPYTEPGRPTRESIPSSPLAVTVRQESGPYALRQDSLIHFAGMGLSAEELAYLEGFVADPRLPIFRRLARAASADWYAANPVASEDAIEFVPMPAWDAIRYLGEANLARGALLASSGDLDGAEEAIRENLSLAFLLLNGTDFLMFYQGMSLLEVALPGLHQLYVFQGRQEEASRLAGWRVDVSDVAGSDPVLDPDGNPWVFFPGSGDPRNQLAFRVADSTLAMPLRWVSLYQLIPAVVCTDPVNLFQGRPERLDAFLETIRPTLVRFQSEEAAFEMFTEHLERLGSGLRGKPDVPSTVRWMAVPSVLLRNPRIQACMAYAEGN